MKIAHEMPLQLLRENVDANYNDYFYALVHLFEESEEYYQYMVSQMKLGREVILDNSIFELEEAFSIDNFITWIDKLVADVGDDFLEDRFFYVVPDVLDDMKGTIANAKAFPYKYVRGNAIAVAQGESMEDLLFCYEYFNEIPEISRIGISFNCEAYYAFHYPNKLESWKNGRQLFIETLAHTNRLEKPLHLLGCSLPSEFSYYKTRPELYDKIASIDTSNPVVHGLRGDVFDRGLAAIDYKRSEKLADMMFEEFTPEDINTVLINIEVFREETLR